MRLGFLFSLFLLASTLAHAGDSLDPVKAEKIYNQFYVSFSGVIREQFSSFLDLPGEYSEPELATILDALEESLADSPIGVNPGQLIFPDQMAEFPPMEQLRFFRLRAQLDSSLSGSSEELRVVSRVSVALHSNQLNMGLIYEILNCKPYFATSAGNALVKKAYSLAPRESAIMDRLTSPKFTPPSLQEIFNLYSVYPSIDGFKDGLYANHARLFMFCRHNRAYPCLMVMRDKDDRPLRNPDGSLWTQTSLGKSKRDLPFNVSHGNTPQGVHLVEGVMPDANEPISFGKFRRLILSFIPSSSDEHYQRHFLPRSSQDSLWWHETAIARDSKRDSLRMHGTGKINDDPSSPFYPHVPTSGCVSQLEGQYGKSNFIDQRHLLDHWMLGNDLEARYENETQIRGALYVIDIDEQERAVERDDLERYGIM